MAQARVFGYFFRKKVTAIARHEGRKGCVRGNNNYLVLIINRFIHNSRSISVVN